MMSDEEKKYLAEMAVEDARLMALFKATPPITVGEVVILDLPQDQQDTIMDEMKRLMAGHDMDEEMFPEVWGHFVEIAGRPRLSGCERLMLYATAIRAMNKARGLFQNPPGCKDYAG